MARYDSLIIIQSTSLLYKAFTSVNTPLYTLGWMFSLFSVWSFSIVLSTDLSSVARVEYTFPFKSWVYWYVLFAFTIIETLSVSTWVSVLAKAFIVLEKV